MTTLLKAYKVCPHCDGTGEQSNFHYKDENEDIEYKACDECDGDKVIWDEYTDFPYSPVTGYIVYK